MRRHRSKGDFDSNEIDKGNCDGGGKLITKRIKSSFKCHTVIVAAVFYSTPGGGGGNENDDTANNNPQSDAQQETSLKSTSKENHSNPDYKTAIRGTVTGRRRWLGDEQNHPFYPPG